MTFTKKLIKQVKLNQGLKSDYSVAKLIDVTPQKMSDWNSERTEANAESTVKLLAAANMSGKDALKMMQEGSAQVALLIVTGLGCAIYIWRFLVSANCILC